MRRAAWNRRNQNKDEGSRISPILGRNNQQLHQQRAEARDKRAKPKEARRDELSDGLEVAEVLIFVVKSLYRRKPVSIVMDTGAGVISASDASSIHELHTRRKGDDACLQLLLYPLNAM